MEPTDDSGDAKQRDLGHATEKWSFDGEVTRVFDDMLERSIPQHDVMREAVLEVVDRHARAGTTVVDLGASRGEATARLLDRRGATLRYVCAETSAPMVEALRARFARDMMVSVKAIDLRHEYPKEAASVVMSVLTLQFVPIEHRQGLLRKAFKSLLPGGALVLVEKVLGATAELDQLMVALYLEKKRASGYSKEEIDRKRLSLEGVLVPLTYDWNIAMLKSAGFTQIDCFWRWMNFAGVVAVKED